ncbi:Gfo/Idh/MocA family protein [Aquisediminimonas sediminicola]|uniref:Gfo/Idh/MocA family protein n=1 Tax=Alteraquisediminimonas sediminicola TaxID=2676787 RepID=UPI001C8E7D84|nr:Gfo/Idh/MocA family oxidoreductase [Aquisediminimonas sediminicola]
MSEKLKFLVVGAGLIGKQHAHLVLGREDCALAGIVGPDTEDNRHFAQFCGTDLYEELSTALSEKKPDAVVISSPNQFHFDQAMACIENGVPALVEKPMTDNLVSAQKLMEASEASQIPVLVGHHRTYSPLLNVADTFLKDKRFGRLVAMQGRALFYKPAHYFKEGAWRTRIGGGPILINLIHEIGLMRYFCGDIKSLVAISGNHIRNYEVEDTVAISFEFNNGALGSFLLSDAAASSKSWEMTSGENRSYPYFPMGNCYHFAGTNGSLDFPSMRAKYYADGVDPSWWCDFEEVAFQRNPADPLALQLEHFIDVVRNFTRPKVSARDGYLNMLVVHAIQRSIATNSIMYMDRLMAETPSQCMDNA